jgi:hypothetical protein
MTFKKTAGEFIFNVAKKAFGGNKQKTTGTEIISKVKPNAPVTKSDKVKRDLRLAVQKSKASQAKLDNTIFRIEQQKKKLQDMQKTKSQTQTRPGKQDLAKGGRVGLKLGTKKKSNVDKIKKTFGTLSVRAGIDNNPNPTYADKIAGAKMKNKNKKKKKFV